MACSGCAVSYAFSEFYELLLVLIYTFCFPSSSFDSPLTSRKWRVMEITEARERDIPVICVVDTDKQPVRQVVDGYMEQVRQTTSLIWKSGSHTFFRAGIRLDLR